MIGQQSWPESETVLGTRKCDLSN